MQLIDKWDKYVCRKLEILKRYLIVLNIYNDDWFCDQW